MYAEARRENTASHVSRRSHFDHTTLALVSVQTHSLPVGRMFLHKVGRNSGRRWCDVVVVVVVVVVVSVARWRRWWWWWWW